jgi:hypothetical protein
MIFRPLLLPVMFLALVEFGARDAQASTLTFFSSQSEFLATAPIVSTETFDEFPSSTSFTTSTVVIDKVTYFTEPCLLEIHLGCWGIVSPGVASPNRFGSNNTATDVLSFGTDQFVNALGFYLIVGGSVNEVPVAQYELRIVEINGETSLINIGPLPPSILFFGFSSSSGIRDLTFDTIGDNRFNLQFDDVSRGTIQSVREPSSPVTLIFAVIGLFILRQYRQRQTDR